MARVPFSDPLLGVALLFVTACRPAPAASSPPASPPPPPATVAPPPAPAAELAFIVDPGGIRREGTNELLVPSSSDPALGAEPRFKRSGPNDLFLVPLADAFAHGPPQHHLAVIVDPRTPYRLLTEVLFTGGQSNIRFFDLFEGARTGRTLAFEPPSIANRQAPLTVTLSLTAVIVDGGVSLKVAGGSIAPGCAGVGPGITIPRAGGTLDLPALAACAARLKASNPAYAAEDRATIVANPTVQFREVLDVALTLQGPTKSQFPKITFGIAR